MDQKAVEQKLKQLRENLAKINPYDQSRSVSIADAIEKMGQAEIISDDTDYWYHNAYRGYCQDACRTEVQTVSPDAEYEIISVVKVTYLDDPIMMTKPEVTHWSNVSLAAAFIGDEIDKIKQLMPDVEIDNRGNYVRVIDTFNKVEIASYCIINNTIHGSALHVVDE
jgi:hypothetical protein